MTDSKPFPQTAQERGRCCPQVSQPVIVQAVVSLETGHGGAALGSGRGRDEAGRALVRYVQLHRQCCEAVAYQRLATFVKQHCVPFDYFGSSARTFVEERQGCLAMALWLLAHDPDQIDKI